DARGLGFGLLEEIPNPRRADADEHLDEFRSAEAEEGHVGLPGDGAGEQRLARSGRTDEQNAFGNPAAEIRVLLRLLQELDDLLELLLGFVAPPAARKPAFAFIVAVDFRAAPREEHTPPSAPALPP